MNRLAWLALLGSACATACAGAPSPGEQPLSPLPPAVSATAAAPSSGRPDRSALPVPGAAPNWSLPKPEVFSLSNGMRVFHLRQGPTPLVSVLLLFPRGSATDPKGKAGLTALAADLLDEGAGKLGALELSDELQRLGTDYSASTDVDSVTLAMNLIAENLEPSIALLADIARRPMLSEKEFKRRKDQRIAEALSAESEPASARNIVLRRALFGTGYAGEPANGIRPTLQKLTLADVKKQIGGLIVPAGGAFVVVGGVDAAPVKKALEASFGDWKGESKLAAAALSAAKPERAVYLVDYPGTTQSALALARRAGPESSPEYFPAMVMSRAFGEAFTSRLNLNLRENKGYTYGAGSSFRRMKEVGYFGLAASVKREVTRASIDESLKELREVCGSRPLTSKERDEAVGGLLLGFPGRFETGGGVAMQLVQIPLYGRSDDWLEKWSERLSAVTLEQAGEIAKQYCNPDDYVIVVAGDKKQIAPSLAELGLPVLDFDAQGNRLKK